MITVIMAVLLAVGDVNSHAKLAYWLREGKPSPALSPCRLPSPCLASAVILNEFVSLGMPTVSDGERCAVDPNMSRQVVYRVGVEAPVFEVEGLTFGVLLCRDSVFPEPAQLMVSRGARVLFVPTNNGMPRDKGGSDLVEQARGCDVARATESAVPVVRADVAGVAGDLVSHGSSGIVNRDGRVLGVARALVQDLVIADLDIREPGDHRTPTQVGPAIEPESANA